MGLTIGLAIGGAISTGEEIAHDRFLVDDLLTLLHEMFYVRDEIVS